MAALPYKYLQILEVLSDNRDGLSTAQIVSLCQKMPMNAVKNLQDCHRATISLGNKIRSLNGTYERIHKITEEGLEVLKQDAEIQPKTASVKPDKAPKASVKPAPKQKEHSTAMKNKLTDLNNHLFAQLERLSDETLKGEKLTDEIDRGKAVTLISREIIANARLVLDAQIALGDQQIKQLPALMALDSDA